MHLKDRLRNTCIISVLFANYKRNCSFGPSRRITHTMNTNFRLPSEARIKPYMKMQNHVHCAVSLAENVVRYEGLNTARFHTDRK